MGKPVALLCVIGFFLLPAFASAQVEARIAAQNTSVQPGRPFLMALHFRMDPGWHIYGKDPGDTGLPTKVAWDLPKGLTAGEIQWPAPRKFESQGVTSYGYEGAVSLLALMTPSADLAAPGNVTIRAQVSWLVCKIECRPGAADLALALPVSLDTPAADARWPGIVAASRPAPPSQEAGGSGLLIALVLAFVGGLILNLMPCVLPVISLKVLSFVRASHEGSGSAFRHGLLFAAGVLVSFWAIAGILLALRAGGQLIGWGFQFQSPAIVTITAALFFLIGLNLLGVFEVRLPIPGHSTGGRSAPGGAAGSFLGGILATAVATPCTAPFMGGALGYALTQPPTAGLGVFTALAAGLAAPYVVLSVVPGLVRRIPRPGPWMVTLRQILAFPMLGAVVWMISVLNTLAGFSSVLVLLSALLAAGLGAWIYGRWGGLERSLRSRVVSACLAIVLVIGPTAFSAQRSSGAIAPSSDDAVAASSWEPWSPDRQAQLQAAGTPVFIDFTAKWCLTCQLNERVALDNPAVQSAFREAGVATLRADWTDRSGAIAQVLAGYGRVGVPVYALYAPGSSTPVLLPELLTPGVVLEALQKLSVGAGGTWTRAR